METDLQLRLHAYAATAAAQSPPDPRDAALYADALSSSLAASSAASAAIICSHPRELRGDSPPPDLLPGQDELDLLTAARPGENNVDGNPRQVALPLPVCDASLADLAAGADGLPAIRNCHG